MSFEWLKPSYRKKTEKRASSLVSAGFKESSVESSLGTSGGYGVSSISDMVRRSASKSSGSSGGSSRGESVQETIEKSQEVSKVVSQRKEAPTETVTSQPDMTPTETARPRDVITVGPEEPGAIPPLMSREEVLEEKRKKKNSVPVTMPAQGLQSALASRFISPQETVSVESEAVRMEESRMGREIIEAPREASQRLSELIVGPVENIPKTESAPRALASAVEWAITLPAETLRTPITTTEMAVSMQELGAVRYMGEEVTAISRDPFGAGVKAGLTAGLIVLPVAGFVRGRTLRGAPERATYRMTVPREQIPSARVDYITDIVFTPEEGGITGRGTVAVRSEGAEALVAVRSFTEAQEKGFRTDVRGRSTAQVKMDLPVRDDLKAVIFSQEAGKRVKSRSVVLRTKDEGQLSLMGKPSPKEEVSLRGSESVDVGEFVEASVGKGASQESILNMKLKKTADVSGTMLLKEVRAGEAVRRKTFTREAVLRREDFERVFLDSQLKELGISQDTLRNIGIEMPKGRVPTIEITKDMAMAERAIQQSVRSFQKTKAPSIKEPSASASGLTKAATRPEARTPVSGLGGLQREQFMKVLEEPQIVRYPPSEGPPEPVQASLNVLDVGQRIGGREDITQAIWQSSRSSRRLRTAPALDVGMEVDVSSLQTQKAVQKQLQELMTGQKTAQRTRERLMLPVRMPPGRAAREFRPPITPTRPSPLGGAVLAVPIEFAGQEKPLPPVRTRGPPRRYIYYPSLGGLASGLTLKAEPGQVTGLGVRLPVKKRK